MAEEIIRDQRRAVGAAAGATIGAAIGGPVGAIIGGLFGWFAGEPPPPVPPPPAPQSQSPRPPPPRRPTPRPPKPHPPSLHPRSPPVLTERFTITSEGGTFGQRSDTGIELQFPQGSLSRGVDVSIQSHLYNPFEQSVPEGSQVVSGVYEVQSEEVKLERGGSITIDHCVDISNDEDRDSIRLIRAQNGGSYEYVDNSKFEVTDSTVLAWLKELAWLRFAVVCRSLVGYSGVGYSGVLYRLKKEADMTTSLSFRFIVVKKLNICIKAVENHYEKCQESICFSSILGFPCSHARHEQVMEPLSVQFAPVPDGEDRKLTFDLEKEGKTVNGWKILPDTFPLEIQENDAYYYLPNNLQQPQCSFRARFEKEANASLPPLSVFVDLKGTTSPESLCVWYDPPSSKPLPHLVSTQRFTITPEGGTFGRRSHTGYELHVPQGSLPRGVDVAIQSHLSNPLKQPVPEDAEVMSGVYQVESKKFKLERGGFITIDHCVNIRNEEDRDSIRVVRARGQGLYDDVDYSQVEVRSSSVRVRLKELASSCYIVVYPTVRRSSVGYCGMVYRLTKEAGMTTTLIFRFIVVKDLNICIKAVENRCESCQNFSSKLSRPCSHAKPERLMEPLPVHFAPVLFGQNKLTLDLEKEAKTANGWKILPVTFPTEIQENDAYYYLPNNRRQPQCSFEACSEKRADGSLPQLNEFVHLKGTTSPQALRIWYDPDAPVPSSETLQPPRDDTAPRLDQSPTMMELVRFEGEKQRHYILEEIGTRYGDIGGLLLEDSNGAVVQAIERQCQLDPLWVNREILCRWLEGQGRKPVTWATLIGVLRDIGMNSLAEDIEGKLRSKATPTDDTHSIDGQTTLLPGGQATPSPDGVLTKAHLPKLMTVLSDSAYESFNLGIQLGLDDHLLRTLERDAGHQSTRFLSSVLSKWLQRRNPPPTLDKLVAAISSPSINNKDLAWRLEHQLKLT